MWQEIRAPHQEAPWTLQSLAKNSQYMPLLKYATRDNTVLLAHNSETTNVCVCMRVSGRANQAGCECMCARWPTFLYNRVKLGDYVHEDFNALVELV